MADAFNPWTAGREISPERLQEIVEAQGAISDVGFRPEQPADYILFKEDNTYYRRNGSTGEIDDNNSNASTLLTSAITDLGGRGLIALKGDAFTLPSKITITQSDLTITGSANRATRIIPEFNDYAFEIGSDATQAWRVVLKNLRIVADNASYTPSGVKIVNARYTLDRVWAYGAQMNTPCRIQKSYIGRIVKPYFLANAAGCSGIEIETPVAGEVNDQLIIGGGIGGYGTNGAGLRVKDGLGTTRSITVINCGVTGRTNVVAGGDAYDLYDVTPLTIIGGYVERGTVGIDLHAAGPVNVIGAYFYFNDTDWSLYLNGKLNYMGLNLLNYKGMGTETGA